MTGTLLATTTKASVHALAFQGILAYANYPQIRDMLRRKFGDDYVLLFAEPVENRQTSEIDWYTPVYGSPRKLEELPQQQREAAVAKISGMAKEIQAFAEELMRSPDQMKVTRGNILRLALHYPDESYIYVCGDQPVFVCWGFGPGTPGVEPKDLTRLAAAAPPPPTATPESAAEPEKPAEAPRAAVVQVASGPRFYGWLWWLLPLFLLLLLLWLLFTSFGGLPTIAGKTLFEGPALAFLEGPESRRAELLDLRAEVDNLRAQLDRHVALCVPEQSKAPEAKPPVSGPEPEGESLVIPEKGDDTRFLQGEWLCRTGLMNVHTREPVEVIFTYDGAGRGKATVVDKSDRCTGDAAAELHNGELVMTVRQQVCERSGRAYNPVKIICRNAEGASASCTGVNEDGTVWQANFLKVK
ncbi:MAG: hypothetical protein HDQ91_05430 [Desulfovibrio sp.]|nr:hypothetical protein [Desulfovibrio sp.]